MVPYLYLVLWRDQRQNDKKKQYNMRNVSYVTMSGHLRKNLDLLIKDLTIKIGTRKRDLESEIGIE